MSSFKRVALITGASSGIGYAIADTLGEMEYGLTIAARRPEKLTAAAKELRGKGYEVTEIAANLTSEDEVIKVVEHHRAHFGDRLDVLVNNAGVGVGRPVESIESKYLDMQLALNFRSLVIFYRECAEMLRAAGKDHRNALVVNLASIAGTLANPGNSVYGATKAAVINFTNSMNAEMAEEGVRSIALCPGFVDTPMVDWVRDTVSGEEMIRPSDLAAAVRFALELSPNCLLQQMVFSRPGAE